jgi:hypothetical protein
VLRWHTGSSPGIRRYPAMRVNPRPSGRNPRWFSSRASHTLWYLRCIPAAPAAALLSPSWRVCFLGQNNASPRMRWSTPRPKWGPAPALTVFGGPPQGFLTCRSMKTRKGAKHGASVSLPRDMSPCFAAMGAWSSQAGSQRHGGMRGPTPACRPFWRAFVESSHSGSPHPCSAARF